MTVLYLGLVCWLATALVVESELFRPLRAYVRAEEVFRTDLLLEYADVARRRDRAYAALWRKLRYALGCHLCTGTWVGFVLVALVPSARPLGAGPVGFVLAGLLVKAIGHATLEATALMRRAAPHASAR